MGFLRESIASDRLEEKTVIAPRIAIVREKNMVTVEFQGATYRSRINGGWVTATSPGGEPISVRHRIRGDKLVQEIRTKKGRRINLFSARGKDRLNLDVIISSPHLPEDVHYDLTYRRVD